MRLTVTIIQVGLHNYEAQLVDTGHRGYGGTVHEALRDLADASQADFEATQLALQALMAGLVPALPERSEP